MERKKFSFSTHIQNFSYECLSSVTSFFIVYFISYTNACMLAYLLTCLHLCFTFTTKLEAIFCQKKIAKVFFRSSITNEWAFWMCERWKGWRRVSVIDVKCHFKLLLYLSTLLIHYCFYKMMKWLNNKLNFNFS